MAGKIQKAVLLGLALFTAAFLCIPVMAAQAPQFRLDMDDLNLQKGVSGNITVIFENAQGAQLINIEGLESFDVVSQSQSSSTSIIQGEASYQIDLNYTIIPKITGQFTLKASIQYGGQYYETNSLQVTVGEGSSNEGEPARDLFVSTNLSHSSAYLGEKIVLTYELYSRYNIENYNFTDFIAIDGMMSKDMPQDQLKAEYVYLDGVKYAKYEVKQLILDPIKSGAYTIPSFNLQVNVITSDGGMGGRLGGFFNFSEPMYLQTEGKEITVKPLPANGKPDDFSDIVGELQLDGRYSREKVNYGDSLSLQVTASGSCNLDGLKSIYTVKPSNVTVYETQKNTAESVADNRYNVEKTFEVILVPEETGVVDVAPVSISYFNPVTEKYERAEIPGVTVEVLGDMPQQNSGLESQMMPAVETLRVTQVNYTDESGDYFTLQMKKQVLFGVLIGLAVLLVLTVVILWLLSRRKKGDPALKSLYSKLMASKDTNEIYDLFNDMIKHCYKLSLKASSQSIIRSSLPDAALAARVVDIMNYMESHEDKGLNYLKDKIKNTYHMILPQSPQ